MGRNYTIPKNRYISGIFSSSFAMDRVENSLWKEKGGTQEHYSIRRELAFDLPRDYHDSNKIKAITNDHKWGLHFHQATRINGAVQELHNAHKPAVNVNVSFSHYKNYSNTTVTGVCPEKNI